MSEHGDRFGEMDAAMAFNKDQELRSTAAAKKAAEEKYMAEQGGKNLDEAIRAEAKYQLVFKAIQNGKIDQVTAERLRDQLREAKAYIDGNMELGPSMGHVQAVEGSQAAVVRLDRVIAMFELAELTDDEAFGVLMAELEMKRPGIPWRNRDEIRQPMPRWNEDEIRKDCDWARSEAKKRFHFPDEQVERLVDRLQEKLTPEHLKATEE